MRHSLLAIGLLALVITGCKKDSKAPAAAPPSAAAAPALAPAAAADPADAESMRSIAGRLAYEAAHRPTGTATVEQVVAALGAAGIEVEHVKQYIGLTAAAKYCAGGRSSAGLGIAVCEYDSPAAAAAGRAHVEAAFANVPGRQIAIHGATTLTTTAADRPDLAELRTKAEAAFAAL